MNNILIGFKYIKYFYDKINAQIPLDAILLSIIILLIIIFITIKIRKTLNRYYQTKNSFSQKLYKVSIPNNRKSTDENNKKEIKQILSGLELFFYNIASIDPEYSNEKSIKDNLKRFFIGRNDHFCIEIVNGNNDLISFYFSLPEKLDTLIRQQIITTWPDSFIEEVNDYNIFSKDNTTIACEAILSKNYNIPLKTYQNFETDPLDILLNSISKFVKGDSAVIQLVLRSSYSSWRNFGKKIISDLNSGKNIEVVLKEHASFKILKSMKGFIDYANGYPNKNSQNNIHKLTPAEEELLRAIENKISKPGMDVNLRVLLSTKDKDKKVLKNKMTDIIDYFSQYGHYGLLNSFKFNIPKGGGQRKLISNIIYRRFNESKSFVLTSDELITLFHLPLPGTEIPNIDWLLCRTAPAIFSCPQDGIILGYNTYSGTTKTIKVSETDRLRHFYILGKSGTGKTNLLKDLAIQDILAGNGVGIIDPHGDFADNVLSYIPKERAQDVIFFDPSDLERPIGLNLYEFDENVPEQKTLIINQFIDMIYTMYDKEQIGGPMFEYYTKNALALNMEDPASGNTMVEIPRVMSDREFRHMKLSRCKDPIIKNFWTKEAEKAGGEAALENIVPYITSKLNQFIQNDFMRNIVGQQKSTIDFADIMNTKKILICKFAKGEIGDMNAQLLGLVVTGRLLITALERTKQPEAERQPFFLYIDECQNFLTPTITTILAEARKYGLGLILANQFIAQLVKGNDTTIKDAIFGNAGTIISFRISTEDAEFMEKQMEPVFSRFDLENAPSGIACTKTLVNNSPTKPFTLETRKYWEIYGNPYSQENMERAKYIKELSRLKYGRPKDIVEKDILDRLITSPNNKQKINPEDELKSLFGEE
ncbi:MAG TPA: type IV secretion system DNA-binding domain-containing protein [bacterium]|nr:type IV secretion system DNA-binding domain-containing protein [bacterium]